MTRAKKTPAERTARILFVSLILCAVYSFVRIFTAPMVPSAGYAHGRSDYILMFIQCLLGLVVLSLPSMLQRRLHMTLPNFIYVMYYIFLYCAIILGEVMNFYYIVPHWDIILHFFSGAMLGALGFILVSQLNDSERVRVSLSPAFIALFAFCFALSCGAVWEIYEFLADGMLGLNMQKFITSAGETLNGHLALRDTMTDIMVDAAAAALIACIGYARLKADSLFGKDL